MFIDPPPVLMRPYNVSALPGDDVHMLCIARSTVPFNVTWYRYSNDSLEDRLLSYNNGTAIIRYHCRHCLADSFDRLQHIAVSIYCLDNGTVIIRGRSKHSVGLVRQQVFGSVVEC